MCLVLGDGTFPNIQYDLLTTLLITQHSASRICAGIAFADAILFITFVSVLAVFDIQKVKDEKGAEITPQAGMTGDMIW
jgi:hypothetical protein